MGAGEIATIIAAVCTMTGAIVSAVLNRKKQSKTKPKHGVYTLPEPFACSSIYHENICSFTYNEREGYRFQYNFEQFSPDQLNIGFVSLVYRFPKPISLTRCKSLTFQLVFCDPGHFNQVDVEIKSLSEMKVFSFQRRTNDTDRTINLQSVKRNILSQVTQLCFVVKPDYHIENMPWNGAFTVNNISLNP